MGKPLKPSKLKIRINNRSIQIDKKDICYCQAERGYSRIFLISGKSCLLPKTLNGLEKQLTEEYFLRCHRSYLVNLSEITSVDIERRIVYQKLYQIPVSHRKIVNLFCKRNACKINEK